MENEEQPKFTIDDLARMVENGFTEMREKIDTSVGDLHTEMSARFAAVEGGLGRRIDNLSHKVDQLDTKLEAHRQETKDGFDAMRRVVGGMSHTLTDHEERIKMLEGK